MGYQNVIVPLGICVPAPMSADTLAPDRDVRRVEEGRLSRLIRTSFTASQGDYGAPRVFLDLREAGETCSKHRVARLMRENGLRALHGYRTRRRAHGRSGAGPRRRPLRRAATAAARGPLKAGNSSD
jgi:transposase InsO family protein